MNVYFLCKKINQLKKVYFLTKIRLQEAQKTDRNNTDINNTNTSNCNNQYQYQYPSRETKPINKKESDKIDGDIMSKYRKLIKNNISYESFEITESHSMEQVKDIVI